jgi:hypothetical protein
MATTTVTDITTRTTALGRVVDALLLHQAGQEVGFVVLGMVLHTVRTPDCLVIQRLDADEVPMATVTIRANDGRYPYAKAYVVTAEIGRVVVSDADQFAVAIADALEAVHQPYIA